MPAARRHIIIYGLLVVALLFASPIQAHRTVRLLIAVPGTAAETRQPFAPLQAWLEAALGHVVEPVTASDWESRLQTWRTTRPEFVLADPAAYAACRASVTPGARIAIESERYYAVVVARQESGTGSLSSLRGARIALGEKGSAVGHVQPLTMLDEAGLSLADVQTLHLEPAIAWKALTRGSVAAVTMESAEFHAQAGDKAGDFTIVARGEPLPPDILFLDQRAGPEMVQRLEEALRRDRSGLERALAAAARRYNHAQLDLLETDGSSPPEEQYVRSFAAEGHARPCQTASPL